MNIVDKMISSGICIKVKNIYFNIILKLLKYLLIKKSIMSKHNIELIEFNDNEYYNASDLHKSDPAFFYGCRNNTRNIVSKKKISEKDYIYAYKKKGEWTISNKSYCKSKVLLTKEWCFNNVPMFAKNNEAKYEVEPAPPLLDLEDEEKFKDADGNVLEIETRGKREVDKCFFKVKDVAKCFEMKHLKKTILFKNGGYIKNVHYKFFSCTRRINYSSVKEDIFLTYNGILRCLFVSRNKHAEKFQLWASKILFTVQLGTIDQKNELVSNVLGVSANAVKEVFNKSSKSIPCVYLFSLGTVKDLKKSMNIKKKYKKGSIVCKYGFTKDLTKRTKQHINKLGKIKNVDLKLKHYSYVDPMYVSNAEADIADFFKSQNIKLEYDNYDELVIIKPKLLNTVKRQYLQLSNAYAGHIKDHIKQVEDLKKELILKDKEMELMSVKHEKELEKERHEKELLQKDLEMERMKNRLLQLENKQSC